MEATKYRLETIWPDEVVQIRDRVSNEVLALATPHEIVTMKRTFEQAKAALKEVVGQYERAWRSDGYYDVNGQALYLMAKGALAAMEAPQ